MKYAERQIVRRVLLGEADTDITLIGGFVDFFKRGKPATPSTEDQPQSRLATELRKLDFHHASLTDVFRITYYYGNHAQYRQLIAAIYTNKTKNPADDTIVEAIFNCFHFPEVPRRKLAMLEDGSINYERTYNFNEATLNLLFDPYYTPQSFLLICNLLALYPTQKGDPKPLCTLGSYPQKLFRVDPINLICVNYILRGLVAIKNDNYRDLKPEFMRNLCINAIYSNPLFCPDGIFNNPYLTRLANGHAVFHRKELNLWSTGSSILREVICNAEKFSALINTSHTEHAQTLTERFYAYLKVLCDPCFRCPSDDFCGEHKLSGEFSISYETIIRLIQLDFTDDLVEFLKHFSCDMKRNITDLTTENIINLMENYYNPLNLLKAIIDATNRKFHYLHPCFSNFFRLTDYGNNLTLETDLPDADHMEVLLKRFDACIETFCHGCYVCQREEEEDCYHELNPDYGRIAPYSIIKIILSRHADALMSFFKNFSCYTKLRLIELDVDGLIMAMRNYNDTSNPLKSIIEADVKQFHCGDKDIIELLTLTNYGNRLTPAIGAHLIAEIHKGNAWYTFHLERLMTPPAYQPTTGPQFFDAPPTYDESMQQVASNALRHG